MEQKTINFKKEKNFNDLISDTIDFIKQEYKALGKALLTYAGPFVLVSAFLGAMYQTDLYSTPGAFGGDNPMSMFQNIYSNKYFLFLLSGVISNVVIMSVVYSYVLLYISKGKDNFSQENISVMVLKNFASVLLMMVVLSFIIAFGFVFFIIPGLYFSIAFSLVIYAKIAEDISFGEAMSKSMYLIKNDWWFTFGVLIVIYIIAYFAGFIFLIPQMIYTSIYTISIATSSFEGSSMIFTIVSVIGTFVSTLLYSIVYITIALLYYSQIEKKDKPSLINKIDEIN